MLLLRRRLSEWQGHFAFVLLRALHFALGHFDVRDIFIAGKGKVVALEVESLWRLSKFSLWFVVLYLFASILDIHEFVAF